MAAKDRYDSLRTLGTAIAVLLALSIALQLLYLVATLLRLGELAELIAAGGGAVAPDPDADLTLAEILQALVGLALLPLSITLIVLVARWTYRAAWNLRHLGASRLEYSPGWAVGWYFVPFANLVMPFRAMKEIWHASRDPAGWRPDPVGLLTAWWTCWLLGNFANNFSMRFSFQATTLDGVVLAERVGLAGDVFGIAAALLLMRIVLATARAQDGQRAAGAEPPGDPAPGPATVAA